MFFFRLTSQRLSAELPFTNFNFSRQFVREHCVCLYRKVLLILFNQHRQVVCRRKLKCSYKHNISINTNYSLVKQIFDVRRDNIRPQSRLKWIQTFDKQAGTF